MAAIFQTRFKSSVADALHFLDGLTAGQRMYG
jgi:hypothetical protein